VTDRISKPLAGRRRPPRSACLNCPRWWEIWRAAAGAGSARPRGSYSKHTTAAPLPASRPPCKHPPAIAAGRSLSSAPPSLRPFGRPHCATPMPVTMPSRTGHSTVALQARAFMTHRTGGSGRSQQSVQSVRDRRIFDLALVADCDARRGTHSGLRRGLCAGNPGRPSAAFGRT